MPSTRYIIRLPPALDTVVQEHLRTSGTPFAVLIQHALSAYLTGLSPTSTLTHADSADTVRELQAQLADLTTRVKVIEEILTQWPQLADRTLTPADSATGRLPGGQRKLTPRQSRALRDKRLRGVSIPALMEEYGISRASVFRYLQSEKR